MTDVLAMLLGLVVIAIGLAAVYGVGYLGLRAEERDNLVAVFFLGVSWIVTVVLVLLLSWVAGSWVLGVLHD